PGIGALAVAGGGPARVVEAPVGDESGGAGDRVRVRGRAGRAGGRGACGLCEERARKYRREPKDLPDRRSLHASPLPEPVPSWHGSGPRATSHVRPGGLWSRYALRIWSPVRTVPPVTIRA